MTELTLGIIKPDAVNAKNSGKIIDIIEQKGFDILCMEKTYMSAEEAEIFYAVHKDRPFFSELVEFISSGPIIVMALEKENAIADWRNLMGATDPKKAAPGTIRQLFGTSISSNVVHGSDAPETSIEELSFFFPEIMEDLLEEEE